MQPASDAARPPDQSVARARRELPREFAHAVASRVEREILERAAWVSVAAALAALLTGYSLHQLLDPRWLGAWVALQLVQAAARVWAARWLLTRTRLADPRALRLVLASAVFAGALWGALPWLPLVAPDPVVGFYTAAIVAGVVAGTSISYSSAPQMMQAIAFPAIAPTVVALALRGDAPGYGAAALMLVLAGLVLRESRRNRAFLERDIAQLLLLEREGRRVAGRETMLRLGADALPEYIAYIDREHRYLFVNKRYVELLGRSRDSIIGSHMRDVVGDWYEHLRPRLEAALAGAVQDFEISPPSRVPRDSHYRVRYVPDLRDDGGVRGVFAVTIEITAYKRAQLELERRAERDAALDLLNAASFRERVAREHEQLQKVGGAHALCVVDLDGLKLINADHGPAAGDAALRQVAEVLKSAVKGADLVGRTGGDEFAVLFRDCPLDIAADRCRALLEAIHEQPLRVEGGAERPLRLSIGITLLRSVDPDPDAALGRADAACYAAQHAGGDRLEVR